MRVETTRWFIRFSRGTPRRLRVRPSGYNGLSDPRSEILSAISLLWRLSQLRRLPGDEERETHRESMRPIQLLERVLEGLFDEMAVTRK